ncbi:MAG: peptidase M23, partial [Albidovulum sp.]
MTISRTRVFLRATLLGGSILTLAACDPGGNFDYDLRNFGQGNGLDTTAAANSAQPRPQPDARGVITYPNYQIAVARQGDTVESLSARVGLPSGEIARYNAVAPGTVLRDGEVLALPTRVAGGLTPAPAGSGQIDVTT